MSERWYSPEEVWPRHPKPWWRLALEEAREADWWLYKASDHAFGTVVCRKDDVADRCKMAVFSSGTGGETVAQRLQRMVTACRHLSTEHTADWTRDLTRRMDSVERLFGAARDCLQSAQHTARAQDLLALAETSITDVETALAGVYAEEEHAAKLIARAWETVNAEGTQLPYPASARIVLQHVSTRLTEMETEVRDAANPRIPELLERAGQLRTELEELRAQLPSCPVEEYK